MLCAQSSGDANQEGGIDLIINGISPKLLAAAAAAVASAGGTASEVGQFRLPDSVPASGRKCDIDMA